MVDDLNMVRFLHLPDLTGNIFFFGRIGSGKTCKMLTIAQGYHSKGYKIWDLYGGKRSENPFWCFPSNELKLWKMFENEVSVMKREGPKSYNVDLIYPLFSTKLPKKLPDDPPRIKCKVVTIPIKSITIQDICLVTGELSSNARYLWSALQKELTNDSNGADLDFLIDTKFKKYKELALYKLFIKPAIDSHILGSENSSSNIDLESWAKQKDVISVLCQDYIPEEFKLFVMGYILRNLLDLVMHDKIHKRNIVLLREASRFMKVQDKNKEGEETTQIFRNQLVDAARYARSGLFIAGDTQSPNETRGMIEGSDDFLGICEMPSASDRDELLVPFKKDRRINSAQIRAVATLPIEQMMVITRGQKAKMIRRIMPPRTRFWKQGDGNFESTWTKLIDKWATIGKQMEDIFNEYKIRRRDLDIEESRKQRTKNEVVEEFEVMKSKIVKKDPLMLDTTDEEQEIKAEDDEGNLEEFDFTKPVTKKVVEPVLETQKEKAKKMTPKEKRIAEIDARLAELALEEERAKELMNQPIFA